MFVDLDVLFCVWIRRLMNSCMTAPPQKGDRNETQNYKQPSYDWMVWLIWNSTLDFSDWMLGCFCQTENVLNESSVRKSRKLSSFLWLLKFTEEISQQLGNKKKTRWLNKEQCKRTCLYSEQALFFFITFTLCLEALLQSLEEFKVLNFLHFQL